MAYIGLERQAQLLAAGAVSSAALVDAALARIEATQGTLNAFRRIRADAARGEAAEADRRLAEGQRAPLLGVPVAIKDDMDLAGEPTAFGCAGDFPIRTSDSEAVRRLRLAGAVIVGKTNTPEFGQYPFTEGAAFGVTRSPWDLDHTPGGSSGGSAVAVSAGVVAAALGSDGAGSVRIPAAWSNLVGIKPQRGRISSWPDPEAFNGLTSNGPLARTVADAAYLLDVVTGNHPGDRHQPAPPGSSCRQAADREPGRLRIALSLRAPFCLAAVHLDPEVRTAVERLASVLEGLGHQVVTADPAYRLMGLSFLSRSMPALREWGQRVPDLTALDHRTQENCRSGRLFSPFLSVARSSER
ncbi:MAG: amidase, partial [Actinomycetota bacterium]|nr:amidase [Actinomycetota bacterium]